VQKLDYQQSGIYKSSVSQQHNVQLSQVVERRSINANVVTESFIRKDICCFEIILYLCAMKKHNVICAEHIKSQPVGFFMANVSDNLFIGNEIMYGTKRKLIDLLILENNKLTGIEIKADNDDFRRLSEQVNESKKLFDYIIGCTTLAHLEKAKQVLPDDIGIFSVNEKGIKKIRKPKKQKALEKTEMLFTINSNFLRKNLSSIAYNINSDEVRQHYLKESLIKIHSLFVDYLQQKIQSKFNLFLQNRGAVTHIEDIPLLSSSLYIQ
jgi:hypothetical protein